MEPCKVSDSLTSLEKRLLERIQQEFPLCPDPYGELAEGTGCTREEAHRAVLKLRESGVIRRIGGSFVPTRLGYVSALAAVRVDPDRLEEVAAKASSYPEVTHNYQRNGLFNLWFTIIAKDEEQLRQIAEAVRSCKGVAALHALPAKETFKLRVHFNMDREALDA